MTAEGIGTKYEKARVPDEERCLFTKRDGNRCKSAHLGNAGRLCILHEGRNQKADEAEALAVAGLLLAKNVELQTKDDVNRLTSQLFTMVAEKRISRQDGSLLAYIASVLLQTIAPVKAEAVEEPREEFVENVAAPIAEERREYIRKGAVPVVPEPSMPGRSNNPYTYPSKWR